MHWFSDSLTHWTEWCEVFELSSTAAHAVGDRKAEAVHLNYLSWALDYCVGRYEESVECALKAYDVARDIGDLGQQAWSLNYAASAVRWIPDSWERAAGYAREALALFKAAGDWNGYPQAAIFTGDCLRNLGRPEESLRHDQELLRELRDPAYEGSAYLRRTVTGLTLGRIGKDHMALGDWRAAVDPLRESMALLRAQNIPLGVSNSAFDLGTALKELDDTLGAREAFEEALAGYEALGDERADVARKEIVDLGA
jgi:tetratricopeptide (TPR) repeat protein